MSLFKKKQSEAASAALDENPYLSARRRWNDYTGGIAASRRMWQAVALISLLMALVAIAGALSIGSQSKFVPYVIQVDRLGQALASAPAERAAPADARVVKAQVADFVSSARLVTPDVMLQRNAIFRVFSMLIGGDPAKAKMTAFYQAPESNPSARMATELVSVEITSVIAQTPTTWQVDWTEQIFDRNGAPASPPSRWRALVTVRVVPATANTTEAQLRANPLGVYVTDYSWSKLTS